MDRAITCTAQMTPRFGRLLRWLKSAYVVAVIAMVVWALSDLQMSWQRIINLIVRMESIVFMGAWMAMAGCLGALWVLWLRWNDGVVLSAKEWLPVQAIAWSGRYLPGKIGLLAGKLALAREQGIGLRAMTYSVLVEQLAFVLSGIAIGMILVDPAQMARLPWLPEGLWIFGRWWMPLTAFASIIAFPIIVQVIGRAVRGVNIQSGVGKNRLLVLFALHAVPHLLIGAAFYFLVLAIFPQVSSLTMRDSIAILALAHVAGIVAIFAPAGIGVREVVLAGGLAGFLAFDEALLLAATLRILTVMADAVLLSTIGMAALFYKLRT